MQKIKKNLSAIQLKFQSLKQAHKLYDDPTPIGEAAQIMTYGVVRQQQVDEYLQHVHNSPELQQSLQINENWFELNITEMILFLDRVIKYRNLNKPKESGKKERLNIVPYNKKKKLKASNRDTHQNPYIPPHIQGHINGQQENEFIDENGQTRKLNQSQKTNVIEKEDSPYVSSEDQQEQRFAQNQLNSIQQQESCANPNSKFQNQNKSKSAVDLLFELPQNFKNYPVQDRFVILLTNFSKNKNHLEKKFSMIYTHYKKEMYIPHETFKTNSEVLMDLRIFLKYYRDFQLSKKFRTNQATNHFKKLAINGIWIDFQNFSELHYKLIDMLNINDKQLTQRLEQGQINDKKKANELKKQLSKTIKSIMQNLSKLKELTDLISDEKIKKLLNDQTGKKIIKKIVQVHSGLVKEDILLRLKQRTEERKNKGSLISISPQKGKNLSLKQYETFSGLVRQKPGQLSVYQMLQIPTTNSRQMKKVSIYSSLELLNIHKEKERLKQLINEEENEKYLEAYFRKQKQLTSLLRSNSHTMKNFETQNAQQHSLNLGLKLGQSVRGQRKGEFFLKNSLSLPRMKFS